MSSYSVFAKYYDDLTANIDYKKRGGYFHEIIKKYNKTDNNIKTTPINFIFLNFISSLTLFVSILNHKIEIINNMNKNINFGVKVKFPNNISIIKIINKSKFSSKAARPIGIFSNALT